jgi:hypothetical protein
MACANDANEAAVVAEGALPSLVQLLRNGSEEGRAEAAGALRNLACANAKDIVATGAIPELVELLRDGSDEGKVKATGTLGNLGSFSIDAKRAIVAAGAIRLLMDLARVGSKKGFGGIGFAAHALEMFKMAGDPNVHMRRASVRNMDQQTSADMASIVAEIERI